MGVTHGPYPRPPAGLDVRALQVERSGAILRSWARDAVETWLRGAKGDGEAAECLLDLQFRPGPAAEWRESRTLRSLKLRHPDQRMRHPISILLLRHVRSALSPWRRLVPAAWRIDELSEPYWPPPIWTVIGALAWLEPRFQRDLASLVRDHFRRTIPVPGGELPLPALRSQVWWLVVDLVAVPGLRQPPEAGPYAWIRRAFGRRLSETLWSLWWGPSRRGRLGRRLSEIARGQLVTATGWAGFWEQWMVGERLLDRPETLAATSGEILEILDLLPLLACRRYREAKNRIARPASDRVILRYQHIVDQAWEDQVPGWFDVERTTVLSPKSDPHR